MNETLTVEQIGALETADEADLKAGDKVAMLFFDSGWSQGTLQDDGDGGLGFSDEAADAWCSPEMAADIRRIP